MSSEEGDDAGIVVRVIYGIFLDVTENSSITCRWPA
jgi:hypothetical protein